MVLTFGMSYWKGIAAMLAVAGGWLMIYLLWMWYLLPELKPYDSGDQLQTARNSEHAPPE
jgi:hypothetical protein